MSVALVEDFTDVPNRATQSKPEFSHAMGQFLSDLKARVPQMNAQAMANNDNAQLVLDKLSVSTDLIARAEAANAFKVSLARGTWASLSALVALYDGQSASVFGDAGTHVDPVKGTVANSGIYGWSVAQNAWLWLTDGSSSSTLWDDIPDKPASFTPAAHTHEMGEITGLIAALSGKAATGSIGTSGLTMASARILGRWGAGTGAAQEIQIGTGLSLVDGVLSYSGSTDMVYPAAGFPVSTGAGWGASKPIPSGDLVGTSAAQTLTQKTLAAGTTITAGTISGTTQTGGVIQGGVTTNDTGVTPTSVGYRGTPRTTDTSRTLTAADNGKLISVTGDVTIPSGLPIGFTCLVYRNSASAGTIYAANGLTARLAGTATTANNAAFRTIAARGLCTITIVNTNEAVCSGNI